MAHRLNNEIETSLVMKDDRTSNPGEPASAQTRCGTHPPHRILVVEDDIHIRQLSIRMLLRSGYQVDAAEDGEAGWEALQARHYDLLITDNNMPNLCGIELVKMLHSACMTLPVIMASGAIPTEELNRYPGLQLAATLLKPFTLDELLGTVKKVLRAIDRSRERIEPLPI